MKKVFQTKFGSDGNCLPACVASMLEIEIDGIPDFVTTPNWIASMNDWLRSRGFQYIHMSFESTRRLRITEGTTCFVIGPVGEGRTHCVIAQVRQTPLGYWFDVLHDPSPPSRPCGMFGVDDVGFLVKI